MNSLKAKDNPSVLRVHRQVHALAVPLSLKWTAVVAGGEQLADAADAIKFTPALPKSKDEIPQETITSSYDR